MKEHSKVKKLQKQKRFPAPKTIHRFWGLATRLEHRRIKEKRK